jgi:hypothetical protein
VEGDRYDGADGYFGKQLMELVKGEDLHIRLRAEGYLRTMDNYPKGVKEVGQTGSRIWGSAGRLLSQGALR